MRVGKVVDWYGYKVELLQFVCEIGINSYWYGIILGVNPRVEMYSFRTPGNENKFPVQEFAPRVKTTRDKKPRRWLKPCIKKIRNKFSKGRQCNPR